MQRVIELGRVIRERKNVSLKTPVREVIVLTSDQQALDDASGLRSYILEELNARQLTCTLDRAAYGVEFKADPNFKALGKRLGPDLQKVTAAIRGAFKGKRNWAGIVSAIDAMVPFHNFMYLMVLLCLTDAP